MCAFQCFSPFCKLYARQFCERAARSVRGDIFGADFDWGISVCMFGLFCFFGRSCHYCYPNACVTTVREHECVSYVCACTEDEPENMQKWTNSERAEAERCSTLKKRRIPCVILTGFRTCTNIHIIAHTYTPTLATAFDVRDCSLQAILLIKRPSKP